MLTLFILTYLEISVLLSAESTDELSKEFDELSSLISKNQEKCRTILFDKIIVLTVFVTIRIILMFDFNFNLKIKKIIRNIIKLSINQLYLFVKHHYQNRSDFHRNVFLESLFLLIESLASYSTEIIIISLIIIICLIIMLYIN